jgi:ABC-type dipeptide/oligopeptide/nickel transport system ATPase component
MEETLRLQLKLSQEEACKLALEKLNAVHLPDARRVFDSTPGQLSGGMLQRAAVAMLLALRPRYILADEPTSALDEENRDILLSLLEKQLTHAGLLLITHDAQAIRMLCRQVLILSAGCIIEQRNTDELFDCPQQDWTREFIRCSANQTEGEFLWKEL